MHAMYMLLIPSIMSSSMMYVTSSPPCSPLIEGGGSFLLQHGDGTVHSPAVLAAGGVHEPGLHHVHRGGHHGGAKPSSEGSREVAGKVICRTRTGRHCIILSYTTRRRGLEPCSAMTTIT